MSPLCRQTAAAAVATAQGIGASLSGLAAGVIVDYRGYSVAFLTMGAAAAIAFAVFALGMPETANGEAGSGLEAEGAAPRPARQPTG